jgi:hypothetical protein
MSTEALLQPEKRGFDTALQRHWTENCIKIFPERQLFGLSPNFYNHISVSDLYIPTIDLPSWLQENRWTDRGNI